MTQSTRLILNSFWACVILGPLLLIAGLGLGIGDVTALPGDGVRLFIRDGLLILFGLVLVVRAVQLGCRARPAGPADGPAPDR